MRLTRTVHLGFRSDAADGSSAPAWGDGGWIVPIEVGVEMDGTPDPVTGYIVPIQVIDQAVREASLACTRASGPTAWLAQLHARLAERHGVLASRLSLRQNPFLQRTLEANMPERCLLTLRFDFAASHRLHCPSLGEEENRRVFGKCNNPAGHGHNYRLEVEVETPIASPSPQPGQLAEIVQQHAVDRLDHKHLNADVPEFRDTNPSVEWIARTCFGWLERPLASVGGRLRRVRLWETEKTSAIYPA